MPPKQKIPAPIDRPISRAYLREFSGWSTAYPPGLSEPTSLRIMENVQIARDGSARVRPGLRYMSYEVPPEDEDDIGTAIPEPMVGTHEAFYLNDGTKAYLFAVRENSGTVGFRVLSFLGDTSIVRNLTDPGCDFDVPQGEDVEAGINFSEATTYVKYLQIDNVIFALSDAGETMRRFEVGSTKAAKRLSTITRPNWSVADKLTIRHPDEGWITDGVPTAFRTNLLKNPNFETNLNFWHSELVDSGVKSKFTRTGDMGGGVQGSYAARLETLPERTNLCAYPLHNTIDGSESGWYPNYNVTSIVANSSGLTINANTNAGTNSTFNAGLHTCTGIEAGRAYRVAWDLVSGIRVDQHVWVFRWRNASGVQVGSDIVKTAALGSAGRKGYLIGTAPAGAVGLTVYAGGRKSSQSGLTAWYIIKNVVVCKDGESTNMFHGGSGTDYYWTGTAGASQSVYHPGRAVHPGYLEGANVGAPVVVGEDYTYSTYVRPGGFAPFGTTARDARLLLIWMGGSGQISVDYGSYVTENPAAWVRAEVTGTAPVGATSVVPLLEYDGDIERGEYHFIKGGLLEKAAALDDYFDGATTDTSTEKYAWSGTAHNSTSTHTTYSAGVDVPPAETKTADTLISNDPTKNIYNVGMFYTFSNEVGETWASQVTVVKVQRPWTGWKWETPDGDGEPSGTETLDPTQCADQLVAFMPEEVFLQAQLEGAIEWSLYMMTWSDQAPVPVEGVKVDVRQIKSDSPYGATGWGRMTPQLASLTADTAPVPNESARYNYSEPSSGAQGLVAADRMVMVLDPTKAAVIKWSSNQQGDYSNFTGSRGGGYKTLTSGNLMVPACVKLWQNPQSVDTLTILCLGTDGRSTGYYMAPAQVASQADATNIMGFEETTATPGTTSPYGVEVFNNALYHPLDSELMKSTASNYNINHKSMTDQIENRWRGLQQKRNIVSSQHNQRLYYIVNNPQGEALEPGCRGNEIWVLDGGAEKGTWSRFLIQAISLREIEQGGRTYMSVVRPDGLYYLDPAYGQDDYVDALDVKQRSIPWRLETNTQGANRAHDAWAHVTQLELTLGNFTGNIRWGVKGYSLEGKPVVKAKKTRDLYDPGTAPWDYSDFLRVKENMREWFFFAESIEAPVDPEDEEAGTYTLPSYGQVSLVAYRYTPVSVNVGYEYGEVETFEYGRAEVNWDQRTTDNGVPMPMEDTRRP